MRYRSLLTISFDNSRRLKQKTHYFSYGDVVFKLVQDNPRKWADHLLTIVENEVDRTNAFRAATEFMSALSWENNSAIAVWDGGYMSWHAPKTIQQARPCIFSFPKIAYQGNVTGCHISRLPLIETDYQRRALALFREARASNNDYLKFLFFWQVLEIKAATGAVGFVDKVHKRHIDQLKISGDAIRALPLNGKTVGQYLLNDCRHAIAHLNRKPGETKIEVDNLADRLRLAKSARVTEAFAEFYIRHELQLDKSIYLYRTKPGTVPIYATESAGVYVRRP